MGATVIDSGAGHAFAKAALLEKIFFKSVALLVDQGCQLLGRVVRIALMETASTGYRYIVRTPGIRGGLAVIEGTRIGVHDVIGLLQNGETVDSVVSTCFTGVTKSQVYECLAYYEDHRDEINLLAAEQMQEPNS